MRRGGAGGWVGGLGSCCCYSTTFTVPGVFVMQLGMFRAAELGHGQLQGHFVKVQPAGPHCDSNQVTDVLGAMHKQVADICMPG